jgi:hypothetical protein
MNCDIAPRSRKYQSFFLRVSMEFKPDPLLHEDAMEDFYRSWALTGSKALSKT